MKVTTEAVKVINLLGDIVAAKCLEKDNYLTIAKMDVGGLPALRGNRCVNLALVLKFWPAYLFQAQEFAPVPRRIDSPGWTLLVRSVLPVASGAVCSWRSAAASSADGCSAGRP